MGMSEMAHREVGDEERRCEVRMTDKQDARRRAMV